MKAFQGSYAAGLAVGAVALGAIVTAWMLREPAQPDSVSPVAVAQASADAVAPAQREQLQPAATQTVASACGSEPAIPPQRAGADGRYRLQAALDSPETPPPSAFVTVAREAAEQGRARDAEVALIAACRLTERSAPAPSAPLSRVLNLLGQHYVAVAGAQPEGPLRETLLARGRDLLDGSVQGYTAVLGAGASRTRDAAQRLAAVQQDTAAEQGLLRREGDGGATSLEQASSCGPGPAHIACRDAELQQLETDLGRLRAQAEAVARDPAGLQRRAAQAEARRDACTSRECLVRWYAQRRGELLEEFGSQRARAR